jgi:lysophospholipase L1-like esterase
VLFRFKEDVLDLNPRAIVILIGTNDLTASQDAAVTIANIRAMMKLRQAQAPNAPVMLCTAQASANPKAPVDARQRRALNDGLKALTGHYPRLSLVDLFAATANAAGSRTRAISAKTSFTCRRRGMRDGSRYCCRSCIRPVCCSAATGKYPKRQRR